MLDKKKHISYYISVRRRVEQLAARRAHNPEAVGSSPTPAIISRSSLVAAFFIF